MISVTEQSLADYRDRTAAARGSSSQAAGESRRTEDTDTVNGDPCLIHYATESRSGLEGNIYVAQCLCRLGKPGLAVALILERQGTMISVSGSEIQRREFVRQVRSICGSLQAYAPPS